MRFILLVRIAGGSSWVKRSAIDAVKLQTVISTSINDCAKFSVKFESKIDLFTSLSNLYYDDILESVSVYSDTDVWNELVFLGIVEVSSSYRDGRPVVTVDKENAEAYFLEGLSPKRICKEDILHDIYIAEGSDDLRTPYVTLFNELECSAFKFSPCDSIS